MVTELKMKIEIGKFVHNNYRIGNKIYSYQAYRKAMEKYGFKSENFARGCHELYLAYELGLNHKSKSSASDKGK